jgi:hypothetical protein
MKQTGISRFFSSTQIAPKPVAEGSVSKAKPRAKPLEERPGASRNATEDNQKKIKGGLKRPRGAQEGLRTEQQQQDAVGLTDASSEPEQLASDELDLPLQSIAAAEPATKRCRQLRRFLSVAHEQTPASYA